MINTNFSQLTKSSLSPDYVTPLGFFNKLDKIFMFTLDAATTKDNPLNTPFFFTEEDDAFKKDWDHNTFINPPFGKSLGIERWISKMQWEYSQHQDMIYCMLLPARVETSWLQDRIWRTTTMAGRNLPTIIHLVKGRLKFVNPVLNKNRNAHIMGSMLWILGDITDYAIEELNESIPGITIRRSDIL